MYDIGTLALCAEVELGIRYNEAISIMESVGFVPFYENSHKEIYSDYASDYITKSNVDFQRFDLIIKTFLHDIGKASAIITE